MKLLLLLFVLGLAGAFPLEDNNICQPHSRPWQVYLHGGGMSCSGALINEWWIVTSFDCAPTPYYSIASLGEHDNTVEEGTEQHIAIADVIYHSPYRSPLHSLAMARLAKPARFTQYVLPIPLPRHCPQPGETCYVSGWGSTIPNQYEPSPHLNCITAPVVDDQTCIDTFPEDLFWSDGMVCAGSNGTDNCMYDSGSVMVCDGQLQGVQWFRHGCNNPDDPTIYTKLCMYNDWINSVMDHYSGALPMETTPQMITWKQRDTFIHR